MYVCMYVNDKITIDLICVPFNHPTPQKKKRPPPPKKKKKKQKKNVPMIPSLVPN